VSAGFSPRAAAAEPYVILSRRVGEGLSAIRPSNWQDPCKNQAMFDRRARVLIADADPGVRRELYQRLLDAEVFADTVADGREALDKLNETAYAVVILDVALALITTERLLEYIAAMRAEDRPVVLVLAGRGAARSLDVDVVQIVLRKPCDLAQLAEIVRSCVRSTAEPARPSDDEPTIRMRTVA
jgi:DNA-binding NtrC family response regulator